MAQLNKLSSSALTVLALAFAAALPAAIYAQAPEPVVWASPVNVTVSGTILAENCNGCGRAGAVSQQTLASGDGYVEFVPSTSHDIFSVGIGSGPSNTEITNLEYALRFGGNGIVEVRENGNYIADTPYMPGQRFRIGVEGGSVNYYKYDGANANLIYSNKQPALQYPLKVEALLLGPRTQIEQVMVARGGAAPGRQPQNLQWTNLTNAQVSGTTLVGGSESQNSGAQSMETLTGDGFIEFTAAGADKMRAIGLDYQNGSNTFEDIDFGIVLRENGIAEVRESGAYISDTPYDASTRFRIAVESGVVKYYKYVNGALQQIPANDSRVANFPLHADAALYSAQAAISDVTGMRLN
jgi:hypothetical protein